MHTTPLRINVLMAFVVTYTLASLLHFSHNAEFIDEYPNLPAWLSRAWVYVAWLGVTAVGVAGCLLLRSRYRFGGLLVLAVYGALGLDGLGHYAVAPISAHTAMMNFTIWFEVATGSLLLVVLAIQMLGLTSRRRPATGGG